MAARVKLIHGDMRKALAKLIADGARVHSVCCDPPYNFASITRRFGARNAKPTKYGGAYRRVARGFMGERWDSEIAFDADTWRLCYELLPPGGYLIAFGSSANYHRLATAIETAGFEIRRAMPWLYATGMPKSHNVGVLIDKAKGMTRSRVPYTGGIASGSRNYVNGKRHVGTKVSREPVTEEAAKWNGWETQLRPAVELICLARKPFAGTVAANVLAHGTGALNVKACEHSGRWPADVLHDGSLEVEEALRIYSPDAASFFYSAKASAADRLLSKHPTVKPVSIMRWLIRLVTPPGGAADKRLREILALGFTPMAMLWRPETPSQERWTPAPAWRAFQRRWARPAIIHARAGTD